MQIIEKLATAKAVAEKDVKILVPQVGVGVHLVDAKIHLVGTIKKGEAFTQRVAAAADPWALLHRALSKMNNACIESLVRESLASTEEERTAVKEAARSAVERITAAQERQMEGRVTASIQWSLLA